MSECDAGSDSASAASTTEKRLHKEDNANCGHAWNEKKSSSENEAARANHSRPRKTDVREDFENFTSSEDATVKEHTPAKHASSFTSQGVLSSLFDRAQGVSSLIQNLKQAFVEIDQPGEKHHRIAGMSLWVPCVCSLVFSQSYFKVPYTL